MKWHKIPIVTALVILVLVLTAGIALAVDYAFFEGDFEAQVEEAIVLGMWDTWDNLVPYGSINDVNIVLGLEPTIAITTIPGYAGAGFVAGESIVIPVNFRNAGDGELALSALVESDGLIAKCCWLTNDGEVTEVGQENQQLARGFKDNGEWILLSDWTATIAGNGGKSGSAVIGAQVLFVRISAPGGIVPGNYTLGVKFIRS